MKSPKSPPKQVLPTTLLLLALLAPAPTSFAAVNGWLHWRGPNQNGTTPETGLPQKLGEPLWSAELAGASTPVIADGKLFVIAHEGEGPDLQELIACFNAETGEKLWEQRFNDYLSDLIYTRYATSNPTIDPSTGNVFMQGSQGILACFSPNGKQLWHHAMMEQFGRLTFPNGRTASPAVDGDLVITHGITANWGANGPARDRFYAFDTKSGELVWFSTPGGAPKDSSYSPPTFAWWNGKRVFYCGTGDGAVVCVNARTGEPIWRTQISHGGVNTQVLIHNDDKLIALHGTENLDNSEIGRMVALKIPQNVPAGQGGEPHIYPVAELELWRNDLASFSSSPILVGDRIYEVAETGNLCAINANSGEVLWRFKIGIEQRNSSLIHADGLLYVPILEHPEAKSKGGFYIIKPNDSGPEILSQIHVDGLCFGTPIAYNGKIYFQTKARLYCLGRPGNSPNALQWPPPVEWPKPGKPTQLQVIPAEIVLAPGESQSFRVRTLDANGFMVGEVASDKVAWASYIPPTARVRASLNASFNQRGQLVANDDKTPSAGAFEATYEGLKGYIRGRVLTGFPITEDFNAFDVSVDHATEENVKFAFPPLPWIGARFKYEIREREGEKVLTKTIDNKLFQRGTVFLGQPDMENYTIEVDVLSDGTRRKMSEVGVIHQRYCVILKGNAQSLEVNSNLERIRVSVPFRWTPNVWYRLKTRVDVADDGSGVVRGKAWKRGEPEPDAWTIEVPHKTAHANGSPGLFGFAPQDMRVYLDNVSVTSNN